MTVILWGDISASVSVSTPPALPSMLLRGVPVEISVETDWFREIRAEVAAVWREGIMVGPGKM